MTKSHRLWGPPDAANNFNFFKSIVKLRKSNIFQAKRVSCDTNPYAYLPLKMTRI